MRVKTRLSQFTEEGLYTGGSIPFGYRLKKRGRVNKRNREFCDLAADENEARIFHKYVNEERGMQQLYYTCTTMASRAETAKVSTGRLLGLTDTQTNKQQER